MDELIRKYQHIVDIIINKYYPDRRNDEDIRQVGLIALWQAAKLFDMSRNIKFETFASKVVKNAILQEIRKESTKKNFLNVLHNVTSMDTYENENEDDGMHDYIKGHDDINYADIKGFVNSLNECEMQIIRLKQRRKTDKQIKEELHIGRRKYEKSLNSAKEKLRRNVL